MSSSAAGAKSTAPAEKRFSFPVEKLPLQLTRRLLGEFMDNRELGVCSRLCKAWAKLAFEDATLAWVRQVIFSNHLIDNERIAQVLVR